MANKKVNDVLRAEWTQKLMEWLTGLDEDVLRVGTNQIAIPVVDSEGEDNYVEFTIKIPSGSRDGDAYDPYGLSQEYEMKQAEKKEKAAKAAEEKARKIARDEEMRRQKAANKAKREGN